MARAGHDYCFVIYVQVTVGAVGAVPVVLVADLTCLFEFSKLTQPAATYLSTNSPPALPVTLPVKMVPVPVGAVIAKSQLVEFVSPSVTRVAASVVASASDICASAAT